MSSISPISYSISLEIENDFSYQSYDPSDAKELTPSSQEINPFGNFEGEVSNNGIINYPDNTVFNDSYIELYIYDSNKNIIVQDNNFINYSVLEQSPEGINSVCVYPDELLINNYGLSQGEYFLNFGMVYR